MSLQTVVLRNLRFVLTPLIYRHCPILLQPPRLYFWLDALQRTRHLSGAVIEVGVALGGTSAFSYKFLRQISSDRVYIGIDTFNGFVEQQFQEDVKLGNDRRRRDVFSANSRNLVMKILRRHGAQDIKLIEGDISRLDPGSIPVRISACLVDVDLAVPVYDCLKLIWPLLEDTGVIVVDDCYTDNDGDWQAIEGYRKFCQEMNLTEQYFHGVAHLTKNGS